MKQLYTLLLFLCTFYTYAQVGIGTETPDPSAQLDISSPDKGLLIPRVTQANRPGSPGKPAAKPGLMIYQTDNDPGFYTFDGTSWEKMIKKSDLPSSSYAQVIRRSPASYVLYPLQGRLVSKTLVITYDTLALSPDITITPAMNQLKVTKAGTYLIKYHFNPTSIDYPGVYVAVRVNYNAITRSGTSDDISKIPRLSGELIVSLQANSLIDLAMFCISANVSTISFNSYSQGVSLSVIRLN
ncbi:hypothetical protein [Siphonobacter sp. SORGH_AS_1065]|uniref:BclA C-terminal domain-containing protein n=1 Tax=Siphonobacter sp. SORGH_AS_1065 TaxID=3041795 RepID=UPI00277F71D2|nr:hypothetical protein [Siphonobacter sp. SORGH_AS_1065]MDQ1089033.1 hypothetical protein [Siphonobacter sp. SORGH_AS_1065]